MGARKRDRDKVVTHTAVMDYPFNSWNDVSVPFSSTNLEYKLTKLKSYKKFSFANMETEVDYNTKLQQFREENDKDEHQSFYYGIEIAGFEKYTLVEAQPGVNRGISRHFISCRCI